jgi:hypothetical protein
VPDRIKTVKVAYVTPESCGAGHAVRGIALVRAGARAGVELRAFGPTVVYPELMRSGYEAGDDWTDRAAEFKPDLLIGDIQWVMLDRLRKRLGVPAWLLVRWMRPTHLVSFGSWSVSSWDRRISIEPTADSMVGITDSIPPIVVSNHDEIVPSVYDGQDVELETLRSPDAPFPIAPLLTRARSIVSPAGYNAYWESTWLGYRDRVRWLQEPHALDRWARLQTGGKVVANGADVLMTMIKGANGSGHSGSA